MKQEPEKGGMSSRLRSWRQNRIQAKACLRGAVTPGLLGRWAKWPPSQSLHSITTRAGIKDNTIFSLLLLPLQLRSGVGVYHVCFYSLDHNCPDTLACIKIIPSKIKDVDFWAPLPPSAPVATISRNPDAGIITLKIMANNDGAHISVALFLIVLETQPAHESLKPQRVHFQSQNFHNILHWQPGRACPGNSSIYFVQYKT